VDLVTPADIAVAAERLTGRVIRTPLLPNARLSDEFGCRVLLKAENLQHTGSFKVRGIMNAMLARATGGVPPAGVLTFSAGNAAAAISYAARDLGIAAAVCMPPGAVPAKVEAVRRYGGEIVFTDALIAECDRLSAERGWPVLHPFDDRDVIAGHGTIATEILADCPDPDLVLVPVGGGGLISGVAAGLRGARSGRTRIVGVEPLTANVMSHALRVGAPTAPPTRPASLADGLAPPFAGDNTLAHTQALVDDVFEVDEAAIRDAWWSMMDTTKLFVEPSAAVGLAALRAGLVDAPAGGTMVLVVSGGNASRPRIAELAGE
jgi:threonine dehydratase